MATLTKSTGDVLETVGLLRQLDLKALPISLSSKATREEGFQASDYVTPWGRWRKEDLGVGLVLGGEKRLIDIDIDDPRITLVAAHMLPTTSWRFGRKSKKSSHFIYSASTVADPAHNLGDDAILPLKTEKFRVLSNDPRKGQDDFKDAILEFRGDGSQTVMPGTRHEGTGELIEWEAGRPTGLPPEADAYEVRKICKLLSMVVLISDHAWFSGQRHDVTLCLAGMMAGAKFKEEDALNVFNQVMMFTGEGERGNILRAVKDTFSRYKEGKKIGGGPMLAEIMGHDFLVTRFRQWFSDRFTNAFEDYEAEYISMMHFGTFTVVPRDQMDDVSQADFESWKLGEFKAYCMNDWFLHTSMEGKKEKKTKMLRSEIWLNHHRRAKYKNIVFEPGRSEEIGNQTFNLWRGWGVKPDPGASCVLWLNHVKKYICGGDEKLFHWMMSWAADIVQDPMRKAGTTLVLCSKEGTGKNTFVDGLSRMIGHRYYRELSQPKQLLTQYNDHLKHALLVMANEAAFASNPHAREVLNALSTDVNFQMEKKFGSSKLDKNYVRMVMASNRHHVIEKSTTDRRFTVVSVKSPADDPEVQDLEKYFTDLNAEIEGDGPSALLYYLQQYKYRKWDIRRPYDTDAGRKQVLLSLSNTAQFWAQCLNDGRIPVHEDDMAGLANPGDPDGWHERGWPKWISKKAMEQAFMLSRFNNNRRDTATSFWMEFYEKSGVPKHTVKRTTAEGRKNTCTLPPLNECIKLFDERCPGAVDVVMETVDEVSKVEDELE